MYKYIVTSGVLSENIIGATSDDDTRLSFGQMTNDVGLKFENVFKKTLIKRLEPARRLSRNTRC